MIILQSLTTQMRQSLRKFESPFSTLLLSRACLSLAMIVLPGLFIAEASDWHVPYDAPQVRRQESFDFTAKPKVNFLGNDKYRISFTASGFCDATVAVVDGKGKIVRHLASGVLGTNAPAPFKKNAKEQAIIWDGKNDLDEYVAKPEKLRVRVSLGLKPEFHKILGWHKYDAASWDVVNIYRAYRAIDIDESGVYILGGRHPHIRKYDHEGKYQRTVFPPPATAPLEGLTNYSTIEYEPGKRALQGVANNAGHVPASGGSGVMYPRISLAQHVRIHKGKFIYSSGGNLKPIRFHRIDLKDGSYPDKNRVWATPTKSAAKDLGERRLGHIGYTKSALSPDGRYIYLTGFYSAWYGGSSFAVHRLDTQKENQQSVFAGSIKEAKKAENRFTRPEGLDVDAQGRVYVCDFFSHVIRVYSPEGKHLKAINMRHPYLIRVDKKRGGIYVMNVKGKGAKDGKFYITRLKSFEQPTVMGEQLIAPIAQAYISKTSVFGKHNNELLLALDSWSKHPRVWVQNNPMNFQVFEDRGGKFKKVLDFHEETKKAGMKPQMMNCGQWASVGSSRIAVDRSSEQLYFHGFGRATAKYDLKTGENKCFNSPTGSFYVDRGFDARGFLYSHLLRGITRHDPRDKFREVAFDYGVLPEGENAKYAGGCIGVIATPTQGDYGNRNGFGVNARGDMAAVCTILYVPKFSGDATAKELAWSPQPGNDGGKGEYAKFIAERTRKLKRGMNIYSVRREAGRFLVGSTVWVYDRTGELKSEDVVKGLKLAAGVQIDQGGNLYTAFTRAKLVNGKPFLAGRGSIIGRAGHTSTPPTGTLFKCSSKGSMILSTDAQIKMDSPPDRPMDVSGGWIENADWLYGGVGPVGASAKSGLDWYGRSFVPENYRHAVGVLDTNGNLVLHVGRYGNSDSGRGKDSLVKVGGDEIAFAQVYYVQASDKYLCVADMGNERIVVLKMNYHEQESVSISQK